MVTKATSSGAINTQSGRSLITGKGGSARSGGVMREASAPSTPNAAAGSSKVRLNGRMPEGDVSEQAFGAQEQISPKEFAAGIKQSFSPRSRGSVR